MEKLENERSKSNSYALRERGNYGSARPYQGFYGLRSIGFINCLAGTACVHLETYTVFISVGARVK
jgi:hypothetical protein